MKLNHRNGVSKAVLTALVITATSGSVWAADYDESNLPGFRESCARNG